MDYSNAKSPTEIIDAFVVEAMPPEPSDSALWPPAIDRILDGARLKNVPSDLNRYALWESLEYDIRCYEILVKNSSTPWKDKVPKLKQLDRFLSSVRAEEWPTWPRGLSDLQKWCRSTLANIEYGSHPELRVRNPIDWLVGHLLPKTFKKHFKRSAAATPTGPYARFGMAVLKELRIKKSNGEDYEAGTIAKTFDEVDKGLSGTGGKGYHKPSCFRGTVLAPWCTELY
jgi:hypothetical protein